MRSVWTAWRLTAKILTSARRLWIPFLITAVTEAFFIGLVWLAPHPPFSTVLAPPIRYFFGERVLHYPTHLWFLYHAMKHTNVAAAVAVGAFMSGLAWAMVKQSHEGVPLSLHGAIVSKQVRYGRVLILWMIAWGVAKGALELIGQYGPKSLWMFGSMIGLTILLQALFVYAIPITVFQQTAWWKALWRGVLETVHHPVSTLLAVIVPSTLVILFAMFVSPTHIADWMLHTAPEITVLLVAARLLVWTLADTLLTITIAHLWWIHHHTPAAAVTSADPVPLASSPSPNTTFMSREGPTVA